ncbi:MAG: hypothetical protein OEZ16_00780 [Chromatiales bacterium]|nr:hypothetical protein [Chromatiales bacterium]
MIDNIEFFGWFIYFWLYMFSEKFRSAWNEEFKQASVVEKWFKVWEALVSTLLGLAPLAVLTYYVYSLVYVDT